MKKLFTGFNSSEITKLNFGITVFFLICFSVSSVLSQPLQLGQSVVTSFEFNNSSFKVVKVIDIRNRPPFIPGGTYWNTPTTNSGSNWTQGHLGQVFGIAIDDASDPNIFVSRSSVYCGEPVSLQGLIYKLDGTTWTEIPYVVRNPVAGPPVGGVNSMPNTGPPGPLSDNIPGLGNLCYDKWHKQLFATNFEDGRIYRIKDNGLGTQGIIQSWFPQIADDITPGFVIRGQRIWGIGTFGTSPSDVRIYYSKWNSDKGHPNNGANEIWSIALDNNGEFIPSTNHIEFSIPVLDGRIYSNPVSDIEFSFDGTMLLGERTMFSGDVGSCIPDGNWAHESRILEYPRNTNGTYTFLNINKVGYLPINETVCTPIIYTNNGAGGVDYSFGKYDTLLNINSECDSNIVGTGDALFRPACAPFLRQYVYGMQITRRSSGGTNADYIDLDNNLLDEYNDKTRQGDVDVYRKDLCSDTNTCMTIIRDTTYCDSTETYIYEFQVRNNSYTKYLEQLEITVDSPQPPNYVVTLPSTINVSPSIPPRGASQVYKVKLIGPGAVAYAEVCYTLSAQFEHDDCPWCCFIENCIKLPICSCAEVLMDSVYCSGDGYAYKFKLQNGTQYDVTKIQLTSPGSIPVTFVPQIFHFGTPIAPGQLFPTLTAQMIGGAAGQTIPVRIKLFSNDFECCYFELSYTLPPCDTLLMNLRSFIEGRYDPATNTMIGSNVEVELRNSSSPYSLVESSAGYLNSSGNCELKFYNAQNGVNYYIVLKNGNSLETWSKSPGQSFNNDLLNYDFLSVSQAYGMNLELIDSAPLYYGILSGDVNQDGEIDLTDVLAIYNDAAIFITGNSDINGDGGTDLTDIVLAYNNALDFAAIVRP